MTRYVNQIPETSQYSRYRNYKDTDFNQIKAEVLTHPEYNNITTETDPNRVAETLQDMLIKLVNKNAPVTTRQRNSTKRTHVTEDTRTLMVARDLAQLRLL